MCSMGKRARLSDIIFIIPSSYGVLRHAIPPSCMSRSQLTGTLAYGGTIFTPSSACRYYGSLQCLHWMQHLQVVSTEFTEKLARVHEQTRMIVISLRADVGSWHSDACSQVALGIGIGRVPLSLPILCMHPGFARRVK